jgi:hypothetical protein
MDIYKDIEGYEGYYQVSNYGNIKSIREGKYFKHKILKAKITDKGYKLVCLFKDGVAVNKKVHRLVAIAFLQNSFNKPDINHINGDKSDNSIMNLEWVTKSENMKHAYESGLMKLNIDRISKKVIDTKKNIIYNSIKEASYSIGLNTSYLSSILNGKYKNNTSLKFL